MTACNAALPRAMSPLHGYDVALAEGVAALARAECNMPRAARALARAMWLLARALLQPARATTQSAWGMIQSPRGMLQSGRGVPPEGLVVLQTPFGSILVVLGVCLPGKAGAQQGGAGPRWARGDSSQRRAGLHKERAPARKENNNPAPGKVAGATTGPGDED